MKSEQAQGLAQGGQEEDRRRAGRLPRRVFRFDEDAALCCTDDARHPRLSRDIEYAIPPFERMYIEFPFQEFYNTLTPPDMRGRRVKDQDVDVGYFYDGPNVYVLAAPQARATSGACCCASLR
jgi:hypothetical protein